METFRFELSDYRARIIEDINEALLKVQKMKVRTQVITLKNGKKKTIKHTRVI